MNNKRKAIDIVLIPPDDIIEECIKYNRHSKSKYINLNKDTQIPHITLLMGGVDQDKISILKNKLSGIAEAIKPLQLQIQGSYSGQAPGLIIKKNLKLNSLHQQIIENISPLLTYDNEIESVYDSQNVLPLTLSWINSFLENSILENYSPHITIGYVPLGEIKVNLPLNFTVDRLAVCHLGNLCTCREILFEINLR